MAEERRTIEAVRADIATERALLADDIETFREQVRAVLPYAASGFAALALVSKGRVLRRAYSLLRLFS